MKQDVDLLERIFDAILVLAWPQPWRFELVFLEVSEVESALSCLAVRREN